MLWVNASHSRRALGPLLALAALIAASACGSKRVLVPPRLDLQPYGQVGLVQFTVENAKGDLHEFATARFAQAILDGQTGIEVLEVGPQDTLVRRVGETDFGPAAAQALGEERDLPAVFVGHLKVSDVKPRGGLAGFRLPHVEATVSVDLTVRLLSTKSGGTVWRSSASASEKIGQLAIIGGEPYFSAKDPNDAYARMVNRLVYAVSHDLRPTWQKR